MDKLEITRRQALAGTAAAVTASASAPCRQARRPPDPRAAAQRWIDNEFQPSTLTKEQQMKEMQFFIDAAKPYQGMEIHVVTEILDTHIYESQVMTKAFNEITGMKVTSDYIKEGDLVEKLQTEMQSGTPIYDMYDNDSDHIGTHFRYGVTTVLSDFMVGEGKDVTLPTLDVDDFIGKSFVTAPDGKMYQIPDQQFANLYWFRADWFARPDLRDQFSKKYNYELGVPVNWSAYEDIAEFFTNQVKEIDGVRIYGHMDYGKKDPSLGWRFTDAWLSMAGAADVGLPNGLPVDEWGIRVEDCHPVGASVVPRRRRQQPGGGLCADEVCRVAEEIRAARGCRHDVHRGRAGAGPGAYRAADLLVFGVHQGVDQARIARRERGRHAEVAHGPLAAWAVLEDRECRTATRTSVLGR